MSRMQTRYGGFRQNDTPYNLRNRRATGAPANYLQRLVGEWNFLNRPSWFPDTIKNVLKNTPSVEDAKGVKQYECSGCQKYFYTKSDLGLNALVDHYITIDHKTPWQQYISDNAEPDDEGVITPSAAKAAYNDPDNLVALCSKCNSSKNGWSIF